MIENVDFANIDAPAADRNWSGSKYFMCLIKIADAPTLAMNVCAGRTMQ
jgi:hypothetical protein